MGVNFETIVGAGASAPWLVMVHGASHDRRIFSAQVQAFRLRYRLQLIDLPGHGLSADIPGPFGHVELAAHVLRSLQAAGVDRCHFWGTHTGTALGLLLAAEHPDRFRSLILEGPVLPGAVPTSAAEASREASKIARMHGVADAIDRWYRDGAWFEVIRARPLECRAEAHWTILSQFSGAPWLFDGVAAPVPEIETRAASIDVPVLLYNGEHDHPEFHDLAARIEALLPRATRSTIADAGGFPAWEFPERVNRLVADFLSGPASSPKHL